MLTVTNPEAWTYHVRQSHIATTRAELWNASGKLYDLYPTGGSVSVDARRDIRRSCNLELVDSDGTLTPSATNLDLAPYGNEIRLYRGIDYGDGTSDEVPLGVFRISETQISYGDDAVTISITGEDRAKAVQRAPFSTAYVIGSSLNLGDVMTGIVSNRLSGVSSSTTATSFTSPTVGSRVLGFGPESDPWADVTEIARAIGQEAYFDAYGAFTTSLVPSLDETESVETYADDSNGVTISIDRSLSIDGISNGVVLTAEGSHLTLPLISTVWDDDASSPFRRTGPLGERPSTLSSSWIRNQTQCDYAALAEYQAVRGQGITLSIVPNARLDVRDVIRITSTSLGIDTLAVIDTITIPLDLSSSMQITARTKGY